MVWKSRKKGIIISHDPCTDGSVLNLKGEEDINQHQVLWLQSDYFSSSLQMTKTRPRESYHLSEEVPERHGKDDRLVPSKPSVYNFDRLGNSRVPRLSCLLRLDCRLDFVSGVWPCALLLLEDKDSIYVKNGLEQNGTNKTNFKYDGCYVTVVKTGVSFIKVQYNWKGFQPLWWILSR